MSLFHYFKEDRYIFAYEAMYCASNKLCPQEALVTNYRTVDDKPNKYLFLNLKICTFVPLKVMFISRCVLNFHSF